jgi:hypothetical protein
MVDPHPVPMSRQRSALDSPPPRASDRTCSATLPCSWGAPASRPLGGAACLLYSLASSHGTQPMPGSAPLTASVAPADLGHVPNGVFTLALQTWANICARPQGLAIQFANAITAPDYTNPGRDPPAGTDEEDDGLIDGPPPVDWPYDVCHRYAIAWRIIDGARAIETWRRKYGSPAKARAYCKRWFLATFTFDSRSLPGGESPDTAAPVVAFAKKWVEARLADPRERTRLLPCIPRFCPDLYDYKVIRVSWYKHGPNAVVGGVPVSGWGCTGRASGL